MRFIETIKNIYKIEELRKRLVYTFLLILVYRFGCFVVLPGIDASMIAGLQSTAQEGLVGLLNMFSGGAFGNASIFALGVMPYISASIVVQLLAVFVPRFRKMQMEGEAGRRKMNQITRLLTILIIAIQGPAYLATVHNQIPASAFVAVNSLGWSNFVYNLVATVILMAGSMFVMWLGERITDRGIGNGISIIIMIGIVARLPYALVAEIGEKLSINNGGLILLLVEFLVWFFVIVAAISLVQAVRKVPIQYAKRVVGNKLYGGVRQYVPLKINAAGVMPIIFAQALMLFPMLFARWDATRGLAAPHRTLHLLLHGRDREPQDDGGEPEEQRRIHSRREARKADRGVSRQHHGPSYPPRLVLPRHHRHPPCNRNDLRREQLVRELLRRYFSADSRGCGSGYAPAGGKLFVDAPLRRSDEDRPSERALRYVVL